jgi:hypothetical protein
MIHAIHPTYLPSLLKFAGLESTRVGQLYKVQNFNDFNSLVDVNSVFSNFPQYFPIDRTETVVNPIKFSVYRPWTVPVQNISLEQALADRAKYFLSRNQKCNLFWSGGIDSTAMVTAFLKHTKNLDQIRIVYSPWSTYEHPGYIEWIRSQYPNLETIDCSGDVYINQSWEGIYINGMGGDELTASMDQSFFELVGFDTLQQPWKNYFNQQLPVLLQVNQVL